MEDLPYVFFGSDDDDRNKDEEGESAQILQRDNDFTYECTLKGTWQRGGFSGVFA